MLTNNRRGALTPKANLDVSLGSEFKRLNIFYGSNIDLTGEIKASKISGDGSGLKNVTLDNIVNNDLGTSNQPFEYLYCKNIDATNDIISKGNFRGNGNYLELNGLNSDIIPGKPFLNIGNSGNEFYTIYGKNIFAANNIVANKFEGDGSSLKNIFAKPDLTNIDMDVIPSSNELYNIGKDNMRFNNIYSKNISANGSIMGNKLMITNSLYPITDGNKPVKAPWNFNESLPTEILEKLGSQIDISCDNVIIGIAIFNEVITDKLMVRSSLLPENYGESFIGNESKPFKSGFFKHITIGNTLSNLGDLQIGGDFSCEKDTNISQNLNVEQTITASNFVGDGRYIYGINKLDAITSNIYPLYHKYIDIGTSNNQFNSIYSKNAYFENSYINSDGIYIEGNLRVNGKHKHNDYNVASHISGFCVPKQKRYDTPDYLLFSEENVSHFVDIDKDQGLITIKKSGIYNIGFYAWSTSRNFKLDPYVLWKIEHYNSYANKIGTYSMKSSDINSMLTNMILRQSDTIKIIIEPYNSRNSSYYTPLTIYERGAFVLTLNTIFDKFI